MRTNRPRELSELQRAWSVNKGAVALSPFLYCSIHFNRFDLRRAVFSPLLLIGQAAKGSALLLFVYIGRCFSAHFSLHDHDDNDEQDAAYYCAKAGNADMLPGRSFCIIPARLLVIRLIPGRQLAVAYQYPDACRARRGFSEYRRGVIPFALSVRRIGTDIRLARLSARDVRV